MSTHRQCVEDLMDCAEHVTTTVPGEEQRVQYLIDSIECAAHAIQATIGLIRNNVGDMRSNFEKSASALIEVDPYVKGRNRAPQLWTTRPVEVAVALTSVGISHLSIAC